MGGWGEGGADGPGKEEGVEEVIRAGPVGSPAQEPSCPSGARDVSQVLEVWGHMSSRSGPLR